MFGRNSALLEMGEPSDIEIALNELARRQIDADLPRLPAIGVPAAGGFHRLAEHPVANVVDKASFFGYRNELVGRHQAALRVAPTQ